MKTKAIFIKRKMRWLSWKIPEWRRTCFWNHKYPCLLWKCRSVSHKICPTGGKSLYRTMFPQYQNHPYSSLPIHVVCCSTVGQCLYFLPNLVALFGLRIVHGKVHLGILHAYVLFSYISKFRLKVLIGIIASCGPDSLTHTLIQGWVASLSASSIRTVWPRHETNGLWGH